MTASPSFVGNAFLDERVRPDDEVDLFGVHVLWMRFLSAFGVEPMKAPCGSEPLAHLARALVMLEREDLRGRHERRLIALAEGEHRRGEGDHRLPRADLSLEKPVEPPLLDVDADLVEHAPLRPGELEGKPARKRSRSGCGAATGGRCFLRVRFFRLSLMRRCRKKTSSILKSAAGALERLVAVGVMRLTKRLLRSGTSNFRSRPSGRISRIWSAHFSNAARRSSASRRWEMPAVSG